MSDSEIPKITKSLEFQNSFAWNFYFPLCWLFLCCFCDDVKNFTFFCFGFLFWLRFPSSCIRFSMFLFLCSFLSTRDSFHSISIFNLFSFGCVLFLWKKLLVNQWLRTYNYSEVSLKQNTLVKSQTITNCFTKIFFLILKFSYRQSIGFKYFKFSNKLFVGSVMKMN